MEVASPTLVVGAVVLNWNSYEVTLECLESLLQCNSGPEAIVVVDNGSHDASVEKIGHWAMRRGVSFEVVPASAASPAVATETPALTLIRVERNLGFAGGNNVGLDFLESNLGLTHFLLLNNDATVAQDFFTELDAAVARFPNAGLLTGTIFEADHPERVWYAGGRIRPIGTLASHGHRVPLGCEPVVTEFISGCAMLISRQALDAVGKLAECYFPAYVEDVEYSFRVGAAGLPIVYAPSAKVYHKVGSTVRRHCTSAFVAYCMNRHRVFFVRRNLAGWAKLQAFIYLGVSRPVRMVLEMLSGRPRVAWAVLRGLLAGITGPIRLQPTRDRGSVFIVRP